MQDHSTRSTAALLLRLALGAAWLAHALFALVALGVPAFAASLAAQGLPLALSWPVALLELVGGVLVIVGVRGPGAGRRAASRSAAACT
ncbi:DoxX family membrane protein [Massilia yuzhufengensis]|uniref:Putative oxidoreductase n=1 Tax=Massilia yuzhufengensis TaxID=1164594 RepID=A0A1I1IF16_9BURK|nr:DoxX family membrane protein [Massilia yuzhufengensis]SFC31800.1 putative oxidoreductase [Massilia yuzhufengensis]